MFRFSCSGCGKCCTGWLPLTLAETPSFAATAPLALVWHAHRRTQPQRPHFRAARKLFPTLCLPDGGEVVPWVRTVVLVPPGTPCAHLSDGLCAVHPTKPLRCRTMPFHSNLPADSQEDYLKLRPDWPCFVAADGKPLYDRGRFLDASYRRDYHAETEALAADARLLRKHVDETVAAGGEGFGRLLARIATTPGGHLVTPWSRLARALVAAGTPAEAIGAALRAQAQILASRLAEGTLPEAYAAHYRALSGDVADTLASWTDSHVAA
ncbi:MAG: YkgJ family cysteine cluster protein [Pseudomonadota bacterium]